MPDESCRKCGFEFNVMTVCQTCLKPTRHFCKNCNWQSQEHYHSKCHDLSISSGIRNFTDAI